MVAPKTAAEKLSDQIAALEQRLTTCTSDECKRLDEAIALLKTHDEALKGFNTRLDKFGTDIPASIEPVAKTLTGIAADYATAKKNSEHPEINPDAYFSCADCQTPLILGKDTCPNEKCIDPATGKRTEIEWGETLASVFPELVEEE